ncbi:NAD(P)H-hydrate epimerase [Halomarina halobia]|uniref:NAD(P)H-hydrate epimerase n=1 Tax=Halomarina halobia TaxID=3033386 RepID=A0ABD6AFE4_9EURY|nr:NAD(P)H-hydrate epimerase [Halomarina sp. PSR21]
MERAVYRTAGGMPVTAVTADEMREVDRVATEEVGLGLLQMMENAGRNLASAVRATGADGAVVLAGDGGNGGGGLACARHLANRDVAVEVVLDRPPAALDGAAARQHRVVDAMGVPVREGPAGPPETDAVVDAVIGYGLSGAVRGIARDLVEACGGTDARVVSLDVPSGLDATTGESTGPVVDPAEVITLALPKTGLRGVDCPVTLADIGIPRTVYRRLDVPYDPPFDDAYLVPLERTGE